MSEESGKLRLFSNAKLAIHSIDAIEIDGHRHQSTRLQAERTSILTHFVRFTYLHRNLTCDALLCSTKESSSNSLRCDAVRDCLQYSRPFTIAVVR